MARKSKAARKVKRILVLRRGTLRLLSRMNEQSKSEFQRVDTAVSRSVADSRREVVCRSG